MPPPHSSRYTPLYHLSLYSGTRLEKAAAQKIIYTKRFLLYLKTAFLRAWKKSNYNSIFWETGILKNFKKSYKFVLLFLNLMLICFTDESRGGMLCLNAWEWRFVLNIIWVVGSKVWQLKISRLEYIVPPLLS